MTAAHAMNKAGMTVSGMTTTTIMIEAVGGIVIEMIGGDHTTAGMTIAQTDGMTVPTMAVPIMMDIHGGDTLLTANRRRAEEIAFFYDEGDNGRN